MARSGEGAAPLAVTITVLVAFAAGGLAASNLVGCGASGAEVRYPVDVERAAAEPEEEPYDDSGFGEEPMEPAEEVQAPEEEPSVEQDGATGTEEQDAPLDEAPSSEVVEQE